MHKVSYTADGINTEFSFSFPFFQVADIKVALNESTADLPPYAIMPNEDFSGGNVVFDTAPAADTRIDIFRQIALSRTVDYQPTAKIDPEDLNTDFNFLLAAFQDLRSVEVDLSEWSIKHDNIKSLMDYTNSVIEDKLSGGAVLGLYRNLVSVLESARPYLINDYGSITDTAPNETRDDYGLL